MSTMLRLVQLLVALTLTTAMVQAAKITNATMQLDDGSTTTTNASTTIYLGTEYNPSKCTLQLASLKCSGTKNDCGELNGYKLECVKLGMQDGVLKRQCQCLANQTDVCQNTTAPTISGVYQFGDCSGGKECADTYGHVPSTKELRICAEKLHCVKEINTTASKPAEICHTCRSCIAQNNAANATLTDVKRFDCTTICPPEILESLAKRNKAGVDIAASLSSDTASAEESGSEDTESSTSSLSSASKGSKSAATLPSLSMTALIGSIILTSLAVAAN